MNCVLSNEAHRSSPNVACGFSFFLFLSQEYYAPRRLPYYAARQPNGSAAVGGLLKVRGEGGGSTILRFPLVYSSTDTTVPPIAPLYSRCTAPSIDCFPSQERAFGCKYDFDYQGINLGSQLSPRRP